MSGFYRVTLTNYSRKKTLILQLRGREWKCLSIALLINRQLSCCLCALLLIRHWCRHDGGVCAQPQKHCTYRYHWDGFLSPCELSKKIMSCFDRKGYKYVFYQVMKILTPAFERHITLECGKKMLLFLSLKLSLLLYFLSPLYIRCNAV